MPDRPNFTQYGVLDKMDSVACLCIYLSSVLDYGCASDDDRLFVVACKLLCVNGYCPVFGVTSTELLDFSFQSVIMYVLADYVKVQLYI